MLSLNQLKQSVKNWNRIQSNCKVLRATYSQTNRIQLGDEGLCFSEERLIKAVQTGFAFPYIFPIFKNPLNSFTSLVTLLKIKTILNSREDNLETVNLGLLAGLVATSVFANNDFNCSKILSDQKKNSILFKVAHTQISMIFHFSPQNHWTVDTGELNIIPSARFTFKGMVEAYDALIGNFDHIGYPSLGKVEIAGNIPFLDKVGYVSRIVQKYVPSMI